MVAQVRAALDVGHHLGLYINGSSKETAATRQKVNEKLIVHQYAQGKGNINYK